MKKRRRRPGFRFGCIYFLVHIPFILMIKVGVASKLKRRKRQLDKDWPGFWIPIFLIPSFFYLPVEQAFHGMFRWAQIPLRRWDGGTEVYPIPVLLPALFFIGFWGLLEWGLYYWIVTAVYDFYY